MTTDDATQPGKAVIEQALQIMQPLVRWLLRSGVGYSEFSGALKQVFLAEAEAELQRIGGKRTDSTRSLLSGLHRKDVRALLPEVLAALAAGQPRADAVSSRPTVASKLITRWFGSDLPEQIPAAGPAPSFESLAREVSQDVHPRTVLNELVRLGVVREDAGQVHLLRNAFVPDAGQAEARRMMTASVTDHLAAGVANVTQERYGVTFLEQSVFADGLSPESVLELERLAARLWPELMKTLIKAATPLYEADAKAGTGDQRFRMGMFTYSAPIHVTPPVPQAVPAKAKSAKVRTSAAKAAPRVARKTTSATPAPRKSRKG